jgi:hypothetical protein
MLNAAWIYQRLVVNASRRVVVPFPSGTVFIGYLSAERIKQAAVDLVPQPRVVKSRWRELHGSVGEFEAYHSTAEARGEIERQTAEVDAVR